MPYTPNTFCHYCGQSLVTTIKLPDGWQCGHCNSITYQNPVPVAVLIVPSGMEASGKKHGVYTVRRGIEPFKGQLALPGGFMTHTLERQETWEQAAIRETAEEINVVCRYGVAAETPRHILTESSYSPRRIGDRVLIIGAVLTAFHIGEFTPNAEALERVIVYPDTEEPLCFPIHRKALALYWDEQNVTHNVIV